MKNIITIIMISSIILSCSPENISIDNKVDLLDNLSVQVITPNKVFNLEYNINEDYLIQNRDKIEVEKYLEDNIYSVFEIKSMSDKLFIFPDEESFYQYYIKIDDKAARGFLLQLALDRLSKFDRREDHDILMTELEKVKTELWIKNSVNDLYSLLKTKKVTTFGPNHINYRRPVARLFESTYSTGASLCVECVSSITNYGDFNCYTKSELPDLSLISKSSGGHWEDVASSACNQIVEGADKMALVYYRGKNFGTDGTCQSWGLILDPQLGLDCGNLSGLHWHHWLICSNLDDKISSVFMKAIWHGCEIQWGDVPI